MEFLVRWLHGRDFALGPPLAAGEPRVVGRWYVDAGQMAMSARWDSDGSGHYVIVKTAQVGLQIVVARRSPASDDPVGDHRSTLRTCASRNGRQFHTWRNWRHLGISVDYRRQPRMLRVEAGPFGAAITAGSP